VPQRTMEQTRISALRREIAAIEGRPIRFGEDADLREEAGYVPALSRDRTVVGESEFVTPPLEGEGRRVAPGRGPIDQAGTPTRVASRRDLPLSGGGTVSYRLTLGLDELDRRLGGGLPLAALHEVRSDETRGSGAATGFAAALLTRLAEVQAKPILWIEEEMAGVEAGLPFGGGLACFGLDPHRLILIRARKAEDALWVFEEGLRCTGLAAALLVLRASPSALDLTVSRRLALRSAAHGVMGLLLRQASEAEPGAATTRWRVVPQPVAVMDGFAEGIGRPAWRAELEKSRLGPVGTFDLEWDHGAKRFAEPAKADPVARPAVPFDRPRRAAGAGTELALRQAG
jgi:protein ImuA